MDRNVAWVVRGYLNLNDDQRAEFLDAINEYNRGNVATKDRINRESRNRVTRMDMGPLGSACACCGR